MRLVQTVVLAWLCCLARAEAEVRTALVIGNAAYSKFGRLDNPGRDATAIAAALRGIGFTVQTESDLGRDAMLKALRRFQDAADGADWALVYYAGHGIEVGGVNYLIPVDARLNSDRDVDEEAVSLAQVQKRLEGARKLRLVILDACRDNPFLAAMKRTQASRAVGRGLGRPDLPQTGSLVAYSAAAGQVASDGVVGQATSPYVTALVRHLATPDLEVNLFFRRVRSDVLRATDNRQEPATYESLPEERYVFRPVQTPPAEPAPATPRPQAAPAPIAALTPVTPAPQTDGSFGRPIAVFGGWKVVVKGEGRGRMCAAVANPRARSPATLKRNGAYLFVTLRSGKDAAEFSVMLGLPANANRAPTGGALASTDPSLIVGTRQYDLLVKDDGAWLRNVVDEERLVRDMSSEASKLTIKTSARGIAASDEYALAGFPDAMRRAREECR